MFRTQNLCSGSKSVFDFRKKHFLFSELQNLFPQHMFPARLNWETFASATMFPSLARPLLSQRQPTIGVNIVETLLSFRGYFKLGSNIPHPTGQCCVIFSFLRPLTTAVQH